MSVSSVSSSIFAAQSVSGPKSGRNTDDFAAVLQKAMHSPQSEQPFDTLELSEQAVDAASRTNARHSSKLDEDGNPLGATVQTEEDRQEFRKVFHRFVGETLYGQMLKSMRETQQKPAYFHGGRAEEIFQGQLDQIIVEKMTAATSNTLSDTMFKLMNM